jgi:hypothetical protein
MDNILCYSLLSLHTCFDRVEVFKCRSLLLIKWSVLVLAEVMLTEFLDWFSLSLVAALYPLFVLL